MTTANPESNLSAQAGGGRHVAAGPRLLSVAGHSVANERGYACQDRWAAGTMPTGGFVVVADGLSGGALGAQAAQTAVTVAQSVLSSSDLDEAAVYRAIDLAHASIAPWYDNGEIGGTTMTVATVSGTRILVGHVGDSPAWIVRGTQSQSVELERVTPETEGRPLFAWLGSYEAPFPTLQSFDSAGVMLVVVCSDGVAPGTVESVTRPEAGAGWFSRRRPGMPTLTAQDAVAALLTPPAVGADDATAAVIAANVARPWFAPPGSPPEPNLAAGGADE